MGLRWSPRGSWEIEVVITNADLTGAYLKGADFTRAKLKGAKGLPKRRR